MVCEDFYDTLVLLQSMCKIDNPVGESAGSKRGGSQ